MEFVPKFCPSCGTSLEWSPSRTDLICPNELCPAQRLYHIAHFCKVMEIEEISAATLEKLNLTSIENLYNLTKESIATISGFGDRSAEIIIEQLQKSLKDVTPAKLIEAFGVQNLGSKNAENLVKVFKGEPQQIVEKFLSAEELEFFTIDGFGPKIITKILEMREYCSELYEFLLSKGLTFTQSQLVSTKLEGLKICMTGASPDKRSRQELTKILESHGAEVQNAVNKKTNILVAENTSGTSSKLKKARDLGVKIVDYTTFFESL